MNNKDTYYKKASKLYDARKYEEAVYWFSMAVSIDQNDADLFSERGVAHFHLGRLSEALTDMDRARQLEPNNPYRYASRAYIRDAMGDVEGAIKDYQQAIFLDPDDAVAHNNLGMLEEKAGRQSKAKALFAIADRLAGDAPSHQPPHETRSIPKPVNLQAAINHERSKATLWVEVKKVFASRKAFTDFITFVRKGFK